MSGEYVSKLIERANAFLEEAEKVPNTDLAMFFVEQCLQLYVKAIYYELFGLRLRGHRLRELLGALARALEEHGYARVAEKLLEFVDENRRALIMIEESYTMSRYGEFGYSRSDVEKALRVAKELRNVLEEVRRNVKLG